MNVTKPEKVGISKRGIIIYSTIVFICILALLVAFYVQFYKRIDLSRLVGINQEEKFGNKSQDETIELAAEFVKLFNNTLDNKEGDYNNKKTEIDKDLVYTTFEKKETKANSYDLEVHIPEINIKSEVVDGYNKEIKEIFVDFVDKILQSENRNVIYTVDYTANTQNGIVEGNNYDYNFATNYDNNNWTTTQTSYNATSMVQTSSSQYNQPEFNFQSETQGIPLEHGEQIQYGI